MTGWASRSSRSPGFSRASGSCSGRKGKQMQSISLEVVLAIVGGAVTLVSSIVGFLMRSLLQSQREKTEQKYNELGNIISGLIAQRKECEERELRAFLRLD